MKSRFLLESIVGARTLQTAMQLTASAALYSKDKDPPLILIDDHLPYPQAILQVFGHIKHCRRKNGRGRFKYARLKPPADLQVGVVKKLRDDRGHLLKVSSKALFGKKKQIEKRIQKLGIGCKINTSHMERLNGTIRGQQARLIRRTRSGSHFSSGRDAAIFDMAVAGLVQLDKSALLVAGRNACDGVGPDQRSMDCFEIYFVSGSCQRPSASGLGRAA